MKKSMLPLAAVAGLAVALSLTLVMAGPFAEGEPEEGQPAARSDESIGPGECSLVHNIEACDDAAGGDSGGSGEPGSDEPASSGPVTSIDDIDPDECSLVHNIDACEEQAVALARDDLAEREGVPAETIFVESAELVQWPDTSLGNPQPDMAYAQVITPGFKLILSIEGRDNVYEYHTDLGNVVTLVE